MLSNNTATQKNTQNTKKEQYKAVCRVQGATIKLAVDDTGVNLLIIQLAVK